MKEVYQARITYYHPGDLEFSYKTGNLFLIKADAEQDLKALRQWVKNQGAKVDAAKVVTLDVL